MNHDKSVISINQARAYLSLAQSLFPVNRIGAMHYLKQAKKCIAHINNNQNNVLYLKRMAIKEELNELKVA